MNKLNEKIIKSDAINIADEFYSKFKKNKKYRWIITGGAGFLLSYFLYVVEVLVEKYNLKIDLVIIDSFFFGINKRLKRFNKKKYVKFIKKDLSSKTINKIDCDFLIHGASIASPTFYRKFPIETIKVNVLGLIKILDKFLKTPKKPSSIIFMSSSEVYGNPPKNLIPTSETYFGNVSFTGPRACYDESKRIGETICINYFKNHNLPIKIIRPFNVYGPGQNLQDKRIAPDIIKGIYKKEIVLFSDGKPKRSFCYISDQIRGILNVMFDGKNGESYNVGNDEMISIKDLAKKFIKISNTKTKLIFKLSKDKNYTIDNPQNRCPNLNKLKRINNWKVKTKIDKGILRTLNYYNLLKKNIQD